LTNQYELFTTTGKAFSMGVADRLSTLSKSSGRQRLIAKRVWRQHTEDSSSKP